MPYNLCETYSVKLLAFRVYRELFSREQDDKESTELFISKARALISQLPDQLTEKVQVDMIYGLLHRRIRKRLPRESVETFSELLKRAKSIEQPLEENIRDGKTSNAPDKKRIRCGYCKTNGHDIGGCPTLKNKNERRVGASSGSPSTGSTGRAPAVSSRSADAAPSTATETGRPAIKCN